MTAPEPARGRIRVGIDIGGTFTDVVAVDERSGAIVTTKTPSTPSDPSEGFLAALTKILGVMGAGARDVAAVAHGTTVATNALLEDRIERLGFITTEGYRYVLEIARQSVPDGYGNSYFWVKPDRIVPVDLVREVGGRLDHTGRELHPFDEPGAVQVARWFRDRGIDTIGVCFIHAYANPDHERRMRHVLAREHPDAVVSVSSEVLREYREYERSVTTLVDAAVKPTVGRYLDAVGDRLAAAVAGTDSQAGDGRRHTGGPSLLVMKSNGGVASADEVVRQPITTVLSGPAAGALGAAAIAGAAGYARLLTLDGGGTSTDVSVILDGEPTLTTEGSIGRFPSKMPMIDIVTVGAGGGSVAWVSPEGNLKVGPRSAGAHPGPLCYGRGGSQPTVTDANLVLGRIPGHLLGGEIALDVVAARAGVERLAGAVGLEPEAAAGGVLEISAWNQANAVRQITVKRGLDVRDFALAAFGGSGPLSACRLIDVLGLRGVVVPVNPGNLSALGLLTVDVKDDHVQTHVVKHADLDLDDLAGVYARLEARASAALERQGFGPAQRRFVRTADLRYFGQAFEVRVPAGAGAIAPHAGAASDGFADEVVAAFHAAHERLYGYCYRDDPSHAVEWVNLRVTGIGPIQRPALPRVVRGDGDVARARTGTRRVCFADWIDTPTYDRTRLAAGDVIAGPAVIEEFGSTLPVHPGYTATVDELANLVVARRGGR